MMNYLFIFARSLKWVSSYCLFAMTLKIEIRYSFSVLQFKKFKKIKCMQRQFKMSDLYTKMTINFKTILPFKPLSGQFKKKTSKFLDVKSHKIARWQTDLSHDTEPISVTHAKRIKFLQWSFDKTVFALLSTSRY